MGNGGGGEVEMGVGEVIDGEEIGEMGWGEVDRGGFVGGGGGV